MMKFYCHNCDEHTPVIIEPLLQDELNGSMIWGDVVCDVEGCHMVIATISVDKPGIYEFVRVREL